MAILEAVPGVEITIRINNINCMEYDDPNVPEHQSSHPTSSKYIESLDNTKFTICISINEDYDWSDKSNCLCFTAWVDSTWIQSSIIFKTQLTDGHCEAILNGKDIFCDRTKSWFNHALEFSTVKTLENVTKERIERDQQAAKGLGLIKIKIERQIYLGKDRNNYKVTDRGSSSFELAEKSLKGKSISHGTILSTGTKIPRPRHVKTQRLPGDHGPIAIFQFRYRSKRALQQELIIPRSPPRSPSLDGLSMAEINRLAKERLDDINAKKLLVKEEPKSMKREKREVDEVYDLAKDGTSARPVKIRRLPSEVIDLTDA
ncbi:hypothetical protein F4814DRAFT_445088 [Daldinia grandis]|nr:hypothetical protein F4814DRAFT_445088 [Daldinia grandis]